MSGSRLVFATPEIGAACYQQAYIVLQTGAVGIAEVNQVAAGARALAREHHQAIGVLFLLAEGAELPMGEVRDVAVAAFKDMRHHIRVMACMLEGRGVFAAAKRRVVMAMTSALLGPVPVTVFGTAALACAAFAEQAQQENIQAPPAALLQGAAKHLEAAIATA